LPSLTSLERSEPSDELDSRTVRQADIDNDDVEPKIRDEALPFDKKTRAVSCPSMVDECAGEEFEQNRVVLDNENKPAAVAPTAAGRLVRSEVIGCHAVAFPRGARQSPDVGSKPTDAGSKVSCGAVMLAIA
jgi:hypothetical protein